MTNPKISFLKVPPPPPPTDENYKQAALIMAKTLEEVFNALSLYHARQVASDGLTRSYAALKNIPLEGD